MLSRLQPNIGNTTARFDGGHALGTWGITPPKVNRSGWNLECSEYIVWGWPGQVLGAIGALTRSAEQGEFFCQLSNARFYPFPMSWIIRNLNTTRWLVRRWILFEQNFENFPVRGCFSKKNKQNDVFELWTSYTDPLTILKESSL